MYGGSRGGQGGKGAWRFGSRGNASVSARRSRAGGGGGAGGGAWHRPLSPSRPNDPPPGAEGGKGGFRGGWARGGGAREGERGGVHAPAPGARPHPPHPAPGPARSFPSSRRGAEATPPPQGGGSLGSSARSPPEQSRAVGLGLRRATGRGVWGMPGRAARKLPEPLESAGARGGGGPRRDCRGPGGVLRGGARRSGPRGRGSAGGGSGAGANGTPAPGAPPPPPLRGPKGGDAGVRGARAFSQAPGRAEGARVRPRWLLTPSGRPGRWRVAFVPPAKPVRRRPRVSAHSASRGERGGREQRHEIRGGAPLRW